MGQNQRIPISIQPGRALWPKGFCLLKPPSNLPPELPPVCLNRGGGFCRPASPHEPCIKIKPSWRIRQSPNCLQVDRNGMTLEFTAMHTHTPATGSSTKEGSTSRGCSRMRISSRSECVPTSCAVTSVPLYLARRAPPGGARAYFASCRRSRCARYGYVGIRRHSILQSGFCSAKCDPGAS